MAIIKQSEAFLNNLGPLDPQVAVKVNITLLTLFYSKYFGLLNNEVIIFKVCMK